MKLSLLSVPRQFILLLLFFVIQISVSEKVSQCRDIDAIFRQKAEENSQVS